MKLSFNLKLSQSLRLTPLLQQSIKLLHASQLELNQLIEDYVNDNIFLELEEGSVNSSNNQANFNSSKETSFKNDYSYELFNTEIQNQYYQVNPSAMNYIKTDEDLQGEGEEERSNNSSISEELNTSRNSCYSN
jgi:DNA-directed RNA polymerase specialized sigma54-like protein